ncbi:HAD family hydrolase [Bradyrhizobium sp.]|jgi:FMN phosphatase YigB (HAD superfamily)|uniref:HAD family hydrolase n=1 Tax=Bradyrhizobium sp. TaxID=376 RepID=UPI003C134807
MMSTFTLSDWRDIRLVAFDVDGTLYSQRPLRLRMGRDLLIHTLAKRDWSAIGVVSAYRQKRERLAVEEVVDFDRVLIAETAKATSMSPERVQAIVSEWIERRPLRYLRNCLFSGVPQLFAGLERAGKKIGIFSDYPATEKLTAMGLAAHHVVAASDVGLLKPHAGGLQSLMDAASATAPQTLFIGDRADRDGVAGQRAGVKILIRSSKPIGAFQTFRTYHDPLFDPFMR